MPRPSLVKWPMAPAVLGVLSEQVQRIGGREGIKRVGAGGMRAVTFSTPKHHLAALTDLAAKTRVPWAKVAGRLIAAVLDSGTASVRTNLGREAELKRTFTMREVPEPRGPYRKVMG